MNEEKLCSYHITFQFTFQHSPELADIATV